MLLTVIFTGSYWLKMLFLFFAVYFLLVVVFLTVFTGFLVVLPGQTLQKFFEVRVQMKYSSLFS